MMISKVEEESPLVLHRILKFEAFKALFRKRTISFTHLDVLDCFSGVEMIKMKKINWLLYDGLVSVQGTGNCFRSTRVVTRSVSGKTDAAWAHVVRVGNTKVVIKPETL